MMVTDLRWVIFDDVTIYIQGDDDFMDLYAGRMRKVPEKLLGAEVKCMGAKKSGGIDIEIRREA